MTFDQIAIFICSLASIYFLSGDRRALGFFIGICGQPFWMYSSWQKGQWGIFALTFCFLYCHTRGFWRECRKASFSEFYVTNNSHPQ